MKNNDKISNYIKDDLENRELNPSHDAWDRIQARMDVAPSPQKSNFKWWLSAAVVALFTVSTSIYLFTNQSKDDQPKEFVNHQEQNNPQQIQSDSNAIHSSESILANNEKIDSSKEVEIKPQAIEWLFATAFGRKFRVSLDNLTGDSGNGTQFKDNVFAQVQRYFSGEATLPRDAALFIHYICVCTRHGLPLQLNEFKRELLD